MAADDGWCAYQCRVAGTFVGLVFCRGETGRAGRTVVSGCPLCIFGRESCERRGAAAAVAKAPPAAGDTEAA